MPSEAYKNFQCNLVDVNQLIEIHAKLSSAKPGCQNLGNIIPRCTVVILCAFWQRYIEEVVGVLVKKYIQQCRSEFDLPLAVYYEVKNARAKNQQELEQYPNKSTQVEGGWPLIYNGFLDKCRNNFNSPNSKDITKLFRKCIGISNWKCQPIGEERLENFIKIRHKIAHEGRISKQLVNCEMVERNKNSIQQTAIETDNFLCTEFCKVLKYAEKPWDIE